MITALYKPLGISTHSFVKKYGDLLGQKVTHTGSLDPMAEGIVVVLTGDDRFKKELLSDVEKEYEFEILLGFKTDSWDLLGLVEGVERLRVRELKSRRVRELEGVLPEFVGTYEQVIPKFSAKRINGESYFDKAKRGEIWEQGVQSVSVKELQVLESWQVGMYSLQEEILSRISKVRGDFRQEEIIKRWGDVIARSKATWQSSEDGNNVDCHESSAHISANDVCVIVKLRAVTSKRFYIRGLVRDISNKTNLPMTTFSIKRIRHGDYSIDNLSASTNDNLGKEL